MTDSVGLVDIGVYMPEQWMTAAEIAVASGIPEDVIRDRFGLEGKHIAGPDDHVSTMGAKAAMSALDHAGIEPAEVDVVAYFGSKWTDYLVWPVASKIQDLVGATNAWALEMANVSCGAPVALRTLTGMMRGDDEVQTVLMVGACRESYLLDYTNQRSRFMFNFADGAAAAVLRADRGHRILSSATISDGSFADFVAVFGGGSRHPVSGGDLDERMHYLDVSDPEAMKEGLDPVSGPNFVKVARKAATRAGVDIGDVALLALLHTKRSFFGWITTELGIPESRAVYLNRHGHMSGIDPLVGIDLRRDDLREGDLVMTLSAGTGYTWAANVIRW
jgi:3-oxoacyl-[acyl-carrier-protein] synthase III